MGGFGPPFQVGRITLGFAFTVKEIGFRPKLLRPFFLHRRQLLGPLCRVAWETVCEQIAEVVGAGVRPGMVAALHRASYDLRWHPHVHSLASRGGWDSEGRWHAAPYLDEKAAELLGELSSDLRLRGELRSPPDGLVRDQ